MRYVAGVISALLLMVPVPGVAQETQVLLVQMPAPFSGVLVPEEAVKRLVQDLGRYRFMAAEVETLKAALAASERENAKLRSVVELSDQMVSRVEKAMEVYDKTLTKTSALIERQEKRIEQLENREKWMMFLGPLGILLGLAVGAAL